MNVKFIALELSWRQLKISGLKFLTGAASVLVEYVLSAVMCVKNYAIQMTLNMSSTAVESRAIEPSRAAITCVLSFAANSVKHIAKLWCKRFCHFAVMLKPYAAGKTLKGLNVHRRVKTPSHAVIVVKKNVANLAPSNAKSWLREKIGHVDMTSTLPARPLQQIAQSLVEPLWNVVTSALGHVASVEWVDCTSDVN